MSLFHCLRVTTTVPRQGGEAEGLQAGGRLPQALVYVGTQPLLIRRAAAPRQRHLAAGLMNRLTFTLMCVASLVSCHV